jgi:hypothetical protein
MQHLRLTLALPTTKHHAVWWNMEFARETFIIRFVPMTVVCAKVAVTSERSKHHDVKEKHFEDGDRSLI